MIAGVGSFPKTGLVNSFPSSPIAPTATLVIPESIGVLAAIAAVAAAIAGLLGKATIDEFQRQDEEAKKVGLPILTEGAQPEIELQGADPGTPTGYHGGSSASQQWYRVFQRAFVQNGEFDSWLSPTYQDAGIGVFYASDLLVDNIADEDFTHFSFDNSPLSEEPQIGETNKQYKLRERKDGGSFQDVLLGTFFGCRFLGYSPNNFTVPDTQDTVYYEGTASGPITTAKVAGRGAQGAPSTVEQLLQENNDLLKFLLPQFDKIIKNTDLIIINQRLQTEIFAQIVDNLANQIQNGFDYILDSLGAQDTEVIPSADVEEIPQIAPPVELPDLVPPLPTPSEPLTLPDGGEALKMPAPELLIDYLPPDDREGFWTPRVLPIPVGDFGKVLADIQDCVCVSLPDCCDEILSELQDIDDTLEVIDENVDDIQWEVDPPLPGHEDLGTASISSTTGGVWTNLGTLVWVKLTQTVAPSGAVKITFANNSGPSVQYVGWFSWNIDGHWTEKQIMTWESGIFPAPKSATGFQFTATHGASYSAQYWYDNRTTG